MCLPTGCGKTVIAGRIAQLAAEKTTGAVFVVDQVNLVEQASARFREWRVPHGILQSANTRDQGAPILIASAQTVETRFKSDPSKALANRLVIIDEAHIRREAIETALVQRNAYCIGLSATPLRAGMGEFYSRMYSVPAQWFFDRDYLVRPSFFTSSTGKGSYRCPPVQNWLDTFGAKRPPTVVYADRVATAIEIADSFAEAGIPATAIHAGVRERDRAAAFTAFDSGALTVLSSCDVLIKGFDSPRVECLVIAKRVKGLARAMQILGRGMRPAHGKDSCAVLDHTGMIDSLGFEIELHWRVGFNQLLLDKLRSKRVRKALQAIAVKDFSPLYSKGELLPRDYRMEVELWLDVCRWVSDRVGIAWRPDAKEWADRPQGTPEHRAYWLAVGCYRDLTGVSRKLIRRVPFVASDRCPAGIADRCRQAAGNYRKRKDGAR